MPEKTHIVSTNMKCRWSINFPILETCSPTPVCEKLCYAKKGRLSMQKSILRQDKVLKIFQGEDPRAIAREVAEGYQRRRLSFLRWNGVGDLTAESCKVINIIAQKYPEQIHWVVTRKPEMVALLDHDMPNVYIQFSLDGSQDSLERKAEVDAMNHPRVYYSFLRFEEEEDTLGASIVFNAQQRKGQLSYDSRCCPADAKRLPVEGACEKCRKCFSSKVYR